MLASAMSLQASSPIGIGTTMIRNGAFVNWQHMHSKSVSAGQVAAEGGVHLKSWICLNQSGVSAAGARAFRAFRIEGACKEKEGGGSHEAGEAEAGGGPAKVLRFVHVLWRAAQVRNAIQTYIKYL